MVSSSCSAATQPPSSSGTLQLIGDLGATLNNAALPLSLRYRALFGLKHNASLTAAQPGARLALEAMASALMAPPVHTALSALLKHEVAYCLGQSGSKEMTPYLKVILQDQTEDTMVRHEAAEALGAIGDPESLEVLQDRRDDPTEEVVVKETCEIAIERIQWQVATPYGVEKHRTSNFTSVDPAPPLPKDNNAIEVPVLAAMMMDPALPLFRRYRAMFTLRDLASPPTDETAVAAVEALTLGLQDSSALFRHEIAFVFGQLSHPASIPALLKTLEDKTENPMVRHEAAEALGGLGTVGVVEEALQRHRKDDEQVVRESIEVALDMTEFEKSGQLEYATLDSSAGNHRVLHLAGTA